MEEDKKVAGKKVMSCTADELDAEGHIDWSQQGGWLYTRSVVIQ